MKVYQALPLFTFHFCCTSYVVRTHEVDVMESPMRVIPNQFSKSLQVTPSELDETWFVSSTCGYMKPDKILLSYVVWLPDYRFNFFPIFAAVATIQILITFPYVIVL